MSEDPLDTLIDLLMRLGKLKDEVYRLKQERDRFKRYAPMSSWRRGCCNTCGADPGQSCDWEKSCGREQSAERRRLHDN